jgi:hypothetical protein
MTVGKREKDLPPLAGRDAGVLVEGPEVEQERLLAAEDLHALGEHAPGVVAGVEANRQPVSTRGEIVAHTVVGDAEPGQVIGATRSVASTARAEGPGNCSGRRSVGVCGIRQGHHRCALSPSSRAVASCG